VCVCACMYICVYILLCVCAWCVHVCILLCVCVVKLVPLSVIGDMCLHSHVYLCKFWCLFKCISVYIHVYVCMRIYILFVCSRAGAALGDVCV